MQPRLHIGAIPRVRHCNALHLPDPSGKPHKTDRKGDVKPPVPLCPLTLPGMPDMKTLTSLLAGAALMTLLPGVAAANNSDMSFAVHDIVVTSNIPIVNISVRNMSPSPDPAMRNLRVTSPRPSLNVSGQVWCKSFQNAHTRADAAQVRFGNAALSSSPNGADIVPLGTWSHSPVANLGGDETLRNFNINAPMDFPDSWNGGMSLGFNPVREVEQRLQQYVQNGAGSAADFLRVDDVFVTTVKMNAVGWCEYDSQNLSNRRYAGYRQVDVQVHIFYHGDPDIQDQPAVGVGSRGTVQAPPTGRGPAYAPPPARRGRDAAPPRRRTPSSRQGGADVREPAPDPQAAADVYIKIPDIDGEDSEALLVPAIQRQQEPQEEDSRASRAQDDAEPQSSGAGSALGDTIRREAARAAVGMLLGSVRAPTGSRERARPAPPARRPGQ